MSDILTNEEKAGLSQEEIGALEEPDETRGKQLAKDSESEKKEEPKEQRTFLTYLANTRKPKFIFK